MGHKERDAALDELADEIDVDEVERILDEIGYQSDLAAPGADRRLVAYYTSANNPDLASIKGHLASRLPDYMQPAHFIQLDSLPLATSGKVNRSALPAPDTAHRAVDGAFIEARTQLERTLGAIWKDVLGVDRVGIRDNFFELGGDSIMAIQIASRAHREGLQLDPERIFDHLTVEELAQVCSPTPQVRADPAPAGPIQLAPIQHWLLDQNLDSPEHWNQTIQLEVDASITPQDLEHALAGLAKRHDALRTSFTLEDSGAWSASVGEHAIPPELQIHEGAIDADGVGAIEDRLHASIELDAAPLLRAALVDTEDRRLLILVAHHLIVDAVSWSVLVEDLAALCRRSEEQGETPSLAPSSAFASWTAALKAEATSARMEAEIDYWRDQVERASMRLPRDVESKPADTIGTSQTALISFDAATTRQLLEEVPRAGRIRVQEILLAAVCATISDWCGERSLRLWIEGHGRESLGPDLDISRTAGWFTALFPAVLDTPPASDTGALIRSIKEQLRAIPQRGLGYGILRYCHPDPDVRRALAGSKEPQILYNYLGRSDRLLSPSREFRLAGPLTLSRAPDNRRPFLLEINAAVFAENLQIEWSFSPGTYSEATIDEQTDRLRANLTRLIAHSLESADTATASDFPLADLDTTTLDKLSALLEPSDDSESKV